MRAKSLPSFTLILSILVLLISFSRQIKPAAADGSETGGCEVSSRCGDAVDISDPFWLSGGDAFCGDPAFEVECTGGLPILANSLGGGSYFIKQIFHRNKSLLVANTQFARGDCPIPHDDSQLGLHDHVDHYFTISTANKVLFLFRNCSGIPPGHHERIRCANDTFAELGESYDYPKPPNWSSECEVVNAPVFPYGAEEESGRTNYEDLLKNGFLVEWWSNPEGCEECRESDGKCGSHHETGDFVCHCPRGWDEPSSCGKRHKNMNKLVIGICVGVGCLVMASFGCFFYYHCSWRRKQQSSFLLSRNVSSHPTSESDLEFGSEQYHTQIFMYEELEGATDGFSTSNVLGDGGFGTVYKGKLRDGRTVAIKRFYKDNYRLVEQFINEVYILSSIRHQNLVTLYGCTSRSSRELLLVYEYVPNGTVADHLHGCRACEGALTWPLRMSIAIETADALSYLHAITPQIIHRDVKTTNILLDRSFHVKVGDFGLSRLFPVNATHVSTAPQGTPGYVDPDYHQCYQLTDKSDVYSFGVMLVELISSKPAVDVSRQSRDINLANMAIDKIQKQELDQLVDPKLWFRSDCNIRTMIERVAGVAFRCLQAEKEMRPPIKEVLEVLKGIEDEGRNGAKGVEADATVNDEDCLLRKKSPPHSPDSVATRWESKSTTPNYSA
ncbi:LEAF RUST 10 DISEASE-RESISTANCE LOCUS RECEPTOR-LIKE PROTEIN KINASE-like 1.2 [Musa acuminata AAA Group]|uniref:LEAF RUST 10 DISEASE-RESISTANCE LOCUS RECEPTOR-LIKE PROTEIN KINASE-like 1.2 n=1 Tax=Musa acuminata AAA Group TaxID=214697 RepID=UPI0031CEC657